MVWLSTLTPTGSGLASIARHERYQRVELVLDDPLAPTLLGEVVRTTERKGLFLVDIRFVALDAHARAYLRRRTQGCASRLDALAAAAECDPVEFCARFPHAFLVSTRRGAPEAHSEVYFVCCRAEPLNPWRAVTIGRDEDCDVRLRAPSVSRRHAIFERDRASGEYIARDLGTTAGTRIEGMLVREQPRRVASKSAVEVGRLAFVFLSGLDAHALLKRTPRPGW